MVITRNDFMGTQPTGNMMDMAPNLEPMTSFMLLDINELNNFSNVNDIATYITNKMQSRGEIFGDTKETREFLSEPSSKQKGNNVLPYVNNHGTMTDPAVNSAQRFQNSYWLNRWDSIDTKFTSATCKIQPANLQPGKNEFNDINHKQSSIRVDGDTRNYLHTGTNDLQHPGYHNNLIYGNLLVDDIYKYWAIDRLLRLDVWNGIVYGGNQEVILERNISLLLLLALAPLTL
jgi:hypothetical protein